jgi:uncharacterized repeat protein (TIGR03803 family)
MTPGSAIRFGSAFLLAIAMLAAPMLAERGSASTFTTLCAFGATSCGSGNPYHPLTTTLKDSSGNVYGTLAAGGILPNAGAVFEINSAGTYVEIYDFCARTACADGETPQGSLIMDVNGNLYGTTSAGGKGDGVAFELSPPASGTMWNLTVLHKFCWSGTCTGGGADGRAPFAGLAYAGQSSGLLYDGTSTLYGTTQQGGHPSDDGTVFTLTPAVGGGWTEKVIYKFCFCGSPIVDGDQPSTNVVIDGGGNLYGTARGGNSGDGVIYELSPSGASWNETILYNFCPGSLSCTDGRSPDSNGITLDAGGASVNLWGTTPAGGDLVHYPSGAGVLYEAYPPDGVCAPNPNWCEKVVYAFCPGGGTCADGRAPSGGNGPVITSTSPYTVFGTTTNGGANDSGVLFKIRGSTPHDLHDFCNPATTCADGNIPLGGLTMDSAGAFYGTTIYGGATQASYPYGYGTAFKFVP